MSALVRLKQYDEDKLFVRIKTGIRQVMRLSGCPSAYRHKTGSHQDELSTFVCLQRQTVR